MTEDGEWIGMTAKSAQGKHMGNLWFAVEKSILRKHPIIIAAGAERILSAVLQMDWLDRAVRDVNSSTDRFIELEPGGLPGTFFVDRKEFAAVANEIRVRALLVMAKE